MASYAAGRRKAAADRWTQGEAYVKRKSRGGLLGHSDQYVMGYRNYARTRCCIRREVV